MARSHGKIHADIWRDPDFRALNAESQRMFFLLLSQPKLTLCGSLDLAVTKWARLASDTTVASIDQALAELEDAGYVVVDSEVDELVIRTFTKHDIDPGRFNSNLAKGLWRSWRGLLSDDLRRVVVTEIPDGLWEKCLPHAPKEAVMCRELVTRRTGRSNERSEPDVPTDRWDEQYERAVGEA